MSLSLPPDPYKILGVSKDAKLPEIRLAHRKLVLKCHPDKVHDADLKAIKQDEFQKVQQAYELLSDDTKRMRYDEQVKLFALRAEMGRGNPTPRSNPFEYEVKSAEPRSSTYTRASPTSQSTPHNSYPPSKFYEEVYDVPYRSAKKSASYESTEKRQPSTRESDRERSYRSDDRERERDREKWEKEIKRSAHGEKKKSRDKERRRGTEEKYSTKTAYVEDESDDYRSSPRDAKSERRRMDDELRMREESTKKSRDREAPMTPKYEDHKEFAAQYMQAARRKAAPEPEFHAPPLRREATYAAPDRKYNITHASPTHPSPQMFYGNASDDEAPRRSSARSRRPSETPLPRSSKESSKKEHRRSPTSSRTREQSIHIVEPPSPPILSGRIPKLTSHSSAPPIIANIVREKPSRSKTQDYPRVVERSSPPLPRAATFQAGDRDHARSGGSRLKKMVEYDSDSDSDSPVYHRSPRHSSSPPPRRDAPKQTKTKYIINENKATPVTRHRETMPHVNDSAYAHARDRSESPRPTRHSERPPLATRGTSSSRPAPQRSHSQAYAPDPVIRDAKPRRPEMPARESGTRHGPSNGRSPTLYGEVKFAPSFTPGDVSYTTYASPTTDPYLRRGSDPNHHPPHRDYAYPSRRDQIRAG